MCVKFKLLSREREKYRQRYQEKEIEKMIEWNWNEWMTKLMNLLPFLKHHKNILTGNNKSTCIMPLMGDHKVSKIGNWYLIEMTPLDYYHQIIFSTLDFVSELWHVRVCLIAECQKCLCKRNLEVVCNLDQTGLQPAAMLSLNYVNHSWLVTTASFWNDPSWQHTKSRSNKAAKLGHICHCWAI